MYDLNVEELLVLAKKELAEGMAIAVRENDVDAIKEINIVLQYIKDNY